MASVAGVTSSPQYDADIIMTREGDALILTLGKSAQKVDTIDLSLL